MTERLEDQGYAVLQVSDRELRRPGTGCEACGRYDLMDSLAPWRHDVYFALRRDPKGRE